MALKCTTKGCKMYRKRVYQLHQNNQTKKWECDDCRYYVPKELPYLKETVYLGDVKSSRARIDNFKSRYILPYDRTDGKGDYYVGYKDKSGKIHEKYPHGR